MNNKYTKMLSSSDSLDRADAIEALAKDIDNEKIKDLIKEHVNDRNYLVRCEVYEALGSCNDISLLEILAERLKSEKNKIAKMYLISAIADTIDKQNATDKIVQQINNARQKEENINALLAYECLYYKIDGKTEHVKNVLQELNNTDYHIRCNVINLLADIIDSVNKKIIIDAYKLHLQNGDVLCVTELLNDEIARIE